MPSHPRSGIPLPRTLYPFIMRTALTLLLLVVFTGCLTIEENYTFKKNGSGTMEYVVDLSEMGEMLKSFGDMAGEDGKKDDKGDMGAMDMQGHADLLKQIPGIAKVKLDTKKEWVQRLSFSFKDIEALNLALNVLMPDSTGVKHTFFAWEGNTLVRTSNRYAHEIGSSMAASSDADGEEGEDGGLDMAAMLGMMKYKYDFKFARPVQAATVAAGVQQEGKGGKQVRFITDFAVIANDPQALDLRIPVGN